MKPPLGKRRTREHVIADLSICFVEWQALRCGFTVERMHHDYGIDLEIMTYNERGERERGTILVQVKATDRLLLSKGKQSISVRIERAHLPWWLSELEPVILIVFDAKRTKAHWLCVQEYFASLTDFNIFAAGETITVRIPVANRLNAKTMLQFAKLRDRFREQNRRPRHD